MHRMLENSDPYVSSLRTVPQKDKSALNEDVDGLLKPESEAGS